MLQAVATAGPGPALAGPAADSAETARKELVAAAAERKKRDHDFALFKKNARAFFERPPSEPRHQRMAARSGYQVAVGADETVLRPAPRDAEISDYSAELTAQSETASPPETMAADSRTIEIGYGERTLTHFQQLKHDRLQMEWRAATERGAALLYSQGDDGAVTAFLYPAVTSTMKPEEDAIFLAKYTNLELLTGRGVLEAHWAALRSYAEATSLDGEPTMVDHARVAWLRFTRPTIRGGRRAQAAALAFAENVFGFAAAIAVSAGLISALF